MEIRQKENLTSPNCVAINNQTRAIDPQSSFKQGD